MKRFPFCVKIFPSMPLSFLPALLDVQSFEGLRGGDTLRMACGCGVTEAGESDMDSLLSSAAPLFL
jgi:hypothetical protein